MSWNQALVYCLMPACRHGVTLRPVWKCWCIVMDQSSKHIHTHSEISWQSRTSYLLYIQFTFSQGLAWHWANASDRSHGLLRFSYNDYMLDYDALPLNTDLSLSSAIRIKIMNDLYMVKYHWSTSHLPFKDLDIEISTCHVKGSACSISLFLMVGY